MINKCVKNNKYVLYLSFFLDPIYYILFLKSVDSDFNFFTQNYLVKNLQTDQYVIVHSRQNLRRI